MKPWILPLNLLYMLCYAWGRADRIGDAHEDLGAPGAPIADLLGRLLVTSVDDLLRRGLDRGYVPRSDEIAGVRGRIDFVASAPRGLFDRGRARCTFDEFQTDVLANQILFSTMTTLRRLPDLAPEIADELGSTAKRMGDVSPLQLDRRHFDRVLVNRNNRRYEFPLVLSRLLFDRLIVDARTGEVSFSEFDRSEMERIFEEFVRKFFEREASSMTVRASKTRWQELTGTLEDVALFPELRTDVTLKDSERWIVIDTKFTDRCVQPAPYSGKRSLRSEHLQQLYSYLQNFRRDPGAPPEIEGILLYPRIDHELHVDVDLQGFRVRVETVDLASDWRSIHESLLAILDRRGGRARNAVAAG